MANYVEGYIYDETGMGAIGVPVVLKGTTTGTSTDADGYYKIVPLSTIQMNTGILVVSYVGYKTVELPIQNRSYIDVHLELEGYTLQICFGKTCYVNNAQGLYDYAINNKPDNFTVVQTECMGLCEHAPVIVFNGEIYNDATTDVIAEIYEMYGENAPKPAIPVLPANKIVTVQDIVDCFLSESEGANFLRQINGLGYKANQCPTRWAIKQSDLTGALTISDYNAANQNKLVKYSDITTN